MPDELTYTGVVVEPTPLLLANGIVPPDCFNKVYEHDDFRRLIESTLENTKDIDLVLIIEALTPEFGKRFWEYISQAGYEHRNKSTGEPQFYRFSKPTSTSYPAMIELFSRKTDIIVLPQDAVLTPIPLDENISSLSAILLDENYYQFLKAGKYTVVVSGQNAKRDYAILMLFLNCGIRRSELVGLNISDVYEDRIRVVGKGNKERIVYLNDSCTEALKNYLAVNGAKE